VTASTLIDRPKAVLPAPVQERRQGAGKEQARVLMRQK
jgi:hypothetical protein